MQRLRFIRILAFILLFNFNKKKLKKNRWIQAIKKNFEAKCSRYQRMSDQTPFGNAEISVPGRLFIKKGKTTQYRQFRN